jgi:hypothetical protein
MYKEVQNVITRAEAEVNPKPKETHEPKVIMPAET